MKKLVLLFTILAMFAQNSLMVFAEDEIPSDLPEYSILEGETNVNPEEVSEQSDTDETDMLQQIIGDICVEKDLPEFIFDEKLNELIEDYYPDFERLEEKYYIFEEKAERFEYEAVYDALAESDLFNTEDIQNLGLGIKHTDEGIIVFIIAPLENDTQETVSETEEPSEESIASAAEIENTEEMTETERLSVMRSNVQTNALTASPGINEEIETGVRAALSDKNYTGLTYYKNVWYYVNKGIVDWDFYGEVEYLKTHYYINGGKIDWDYAGLAEIGQEVWYFDNAKWQRNYTGLVPDNGGRMVYVKEGKADYGYSGLSYYQGVWYYISKGIEDKEFSDAVLYNGTYYYVKNGKIDWSYAGLTDIHGELWYFDNAKWNKTYSGLAEYGSELYKIADGVIDSQYTGLTYYKNVWYYVNKGIVDFGYTGLAEYLKSDFYIQKGIIIWGVTGLININGKLMYIDDSRVNKTYESLVYYDGKWYKIRNGVIDSSYTGLVKYNGSWFYVEKGVLNWNYSGAVKYNNAWFYVKEGKIDWSFSGTITDGDDTYFVQGGKIIVTGFKKDQTYYQIDPKTGKIVHEQKLMNDYIYLEGIDVSEHNGYIDLSDYQNGFVIIRIGWWTNPDRMAERNMDLCEKYNIPYGVYLYDYTTDPEDAVKEAEFTLRMIEGRNVRCGVWFDMEDDGWRARNGVPPYHPNISKLCQAYCERITQAGYHVGIYASYSWFENYITGCDKYDKWVAHWGSNNGNWNVNLSGYCPLHQYTSIPLDKNVMYVDPSYFR